MLTIVKQWSNNAICCLARQSKFHEETISIKMSYETEYYKEFQKFYNKQLATLNEPESPEQNEGCFILDRDTGIKYDPLTFEQSSPVKFDVESAWRNYWDQCSLLNEQLLSYVQKNDIENVVNLMSFLRGSYFIDINAKDLDDWTSLHFACNQNSIEMVTKLIDFGADVDCETQQKRRPIHFAAQRNNVKIIELLIQKGCNLSARDQDQNTPLHVASEFGSVDACRLLLELTKNPDDRLAKNSMHLTAVELASNGEVHKVFEQQNIFLKDIRYSRTFIPEINVILHNARSDHITRLLELSTKQMHSQQLSAELPVEEILKELDEGQSAKQQKSQVQENRSTWSKIVNFAMRFTNIIIQRKDPQEDESDILGPNSFIQYQKLGEGGFGKVYLAEKKGAAQKKYFAMKVLKKEDMESSNMIKSAQIERDVLKIMDHPFIVKLNYAFQTNSHLYLVMDLCPGGDLANLLELKQKIPEDTAKIYAAEITLALEALHRYGIIFRDLKPQNVVIDADGHVLLTDFGLSKQGADENVLNNSFCGTLAYLAPEVLLRRGYGRQVDWYMLGVLIYELLVGSPPYMDEEKEILKDLIRRGTYKIPKDMSSDAKDLIKKLLMRNPKQRLGSINDSQDIKSHSWFKDISWSECYDRKLNPPKPTIIHEPKELERKKKSIGQTKSKNRVQGWTFFDE